MKVENILDYLKLWSIETPDKIAYIFLEYLDNICYERSITCKEFYQKVCVYAYYLIKSGVKKGERVIVIANQCAETIYAIYAVLLSGGVLVLVPPIEDEEKQNRLEFTIRSSKAEYVIGNEIDNDLTEGYINYLNIRHIENDIKRKVREHIEEQNLLEDEAIKIFIEEVVQTLDVLERSLNDIACIQYTSGSVSDPKGVMLSYNNIMEAMKIQQKEYFTEGSDINVTWLPYFHTMELTCGIFFNVYTNRKSIYMRTADFMEKPSRWFEVIMKYKATMTIGPISGYIAAVKDLDYDTKIDLSSIKYMISSSEPVQKKDYQYIYDNLNKYQLKEGTFYTGLGMTEASTIITIEKGVIDTITVDIKELENNRIKICDEDYKDSRVLSSVGEITNGIEMKIVNPFTLKECADAEIGEIWIKGGCKACGYWNQQEKTKETFMVNLPKYKGTFLRSGDLGYILNNKLYITGRCKDILIINGHNIYTKDIEYILKDKIANLESQVIQSFSIYKDNSEHLVIMIEDENNNKDYNELINKINNIILRYFNIEAYDILFIEKDKIPRTDNGKVSASKIKQQYECRDIESIYSLRNNKSNGDITSFTEASLKIKEIFEKILGTECRSLNDNFFELGGSSLKIIKLIKEIRGSFGVHIKTTDILKGGTIRDIEKFINNN